MSRRCGTQQIEFDMLPLNSSDHKENSCSFPRERPTFKVRSVKRLYRVASTGAQCSAPLLLFLALCSTSHSPSASISGEI